ncbi:hypothetical protein [Caballeronia grimmiae]|uniref:Uncharacterized protein n=1 Tax=Caballeronia grimmiae TaxID=1071679 RepID=A0ABQ1RD35_9BURK|nr:hypothetical protein [Caballeronia grimmiae]GGD63185.1 hypothetical protein GCM10010985_16610 [Caballeronia grimmiae]
MNIPAFPNLITTGRFFDGPLTAEWQARERAKSEPKICIGCGAKQNADGTLPCGHDHDL